VEASWSRKLGSKRGCPNDLDGKLASHVLWCSRHSYNGNARHGNANAAAHANAVTYGYVLAATNGYVLAATNGYADAATRYDAARNANAAAHGNANAAANGDADAAARNVPVSDAPLAAGLPQCRLATYDAIRLAATTIPSRRLPIPPLVSVCQFRSSLLTRLC